MGLGIAILIGSVMMDRLENKASTLTPSPTASGLLGIAMTILGRCSRAQLAPLCYQLPPRWMRRSSAR
jgi:hypothetical protein